MASSSVSTYLDIARAGKGWAPARETLDAGAMGESAKVVAAIHKGTEAVPEIPDKTELSLDQVMSAIGWLTKNGLATVEQAQGRPLTVHLTESARSALTSG